MRLVPVTRTQRARIGEEDKRQHRAELLEARARRVAQESRRYNRLAAQHLRFSTLEKHHNPAHGVVAHGSFQYRTPTLSSGRKMERKY